MKPAASLRGAWRRLQNGTAAVELALILSATINGIAAAPFLIVTMLISGDKDIMGEYGNGKLAATLGWTTTAIMVVAGGIGLWTTITGG